MSTGDGMDRQDAAIDDLGLPAEVLAILRTLQQEPVGGTGAALSLARLSKRTQLRMSTLRRFLAALEEAGVVQVELNEDGTGSVRLLPAPDA